ncbi:MAG: 30S ribosomal protein S6--L-glutamate ligase [Acidobacteriota bacterium]
MKVLILSRKTSLYSTSRLLEVGRGRGHDVRSIDYLRCTMNITSRRPTVMYQGTPLADVDAVIPRIGATYTFYGSAVVRQLELMGVFCANDSQAISRSRDKLRSLQVLARHGVGLPVTSFAHHTRDTDGLIEIVGGPPVVIKLLEGTQGLGVVLAETRQAATSVIEAFRKLDANILVQEFIEESGAADIRAFVVGDRVVAAMRRQGAPGEFRSNLHRGGSADAVELDDEERDTAVEAVHALGLEVAGVDMIRSRRGPLVLEVNSSPGLEGIERTTGVDVAGSIYALLERRGDSSRESE